MVTMRDVYYVFDKINDQLMEMAVIGKVDEGMMRRLNDRTQRIIELIPQELGISEQACRELPGVTEIGPRAEEELCALKMLFDIR